MDWLERMVTLLGDIKVLALWACTYPFKAVLFELRPRFTRFLDCIGHGSCPKVPELMSSLKYVLLLFLSKDDLSGHIIRLELMHVCFIHYESGADLEI